MKKTLMMAGALACALGSVIFGNKIQESQVEEAVDKRLKELTEKDSEEEATE